MLDFAPLFDPQNLPSLLTLAALEIVLGIDNVIFITILAGKLPKEKQRFARQMGLAVALISRIGLLFAISWVMTLSEPLFTLPVLNRAMSGKDLILVFGGLFLLGKAVHEIYENVERPAEHQPKEMEKSGVIDTRVGKAAMAAFLFQVVLLDVVFSLDSVITAVGIVGDASKLIIMIVAVLAAVVVMMLGAGPIGDFVQKHASIRILALSFLVMIGTLLIAEGFDQHIQKGYVYFSMGFALLIDLLNMRMKSRAERIRENARKEEAA